ncbi:MAG: ADP-ribosyltransferase [Rickettsia endosymbiont of Pentastiridius leporinus]
MSELEKLLKSNQLKKITDLISTKEKNKYPFGPLNKSTESKVFETIVQDLINDYNNPNKKIQLFKNNKNEIILKKNNAQISLSEFMKNVNLNHISLPKQAIKKYAEIGFPRLELKTINNTQSIVSLPPLTHNQFLERIENTNTPQTKDLKKLEYGEMAAINQYTSFKYQDINNLLRDSNSLPIEKIPEMIMHIAVASHGLNKIPDIKLPIVIRNQQSELLNEYINNVKENKVTAEKAFISTSYESQENFNSKNKSEGIKIIFKDVKGKDISPLSQYPNEKEYLLPPSTQLKWSGYSKTKLGHVFITEGANVLLDEIVKPIVGKTYNSSHDAPPAYIPPPDYNDHSKTNTKSKTIPLEPPPDYDNKPISKHTNHTLVNPIKNKVELPNVKKIIEDLQKSLSKEATKTSANPPFQSTKLSKNSNSWSK